MNTIENQNAIFPKGEKVSADYFIGTAWVNILVPQDETGIYAIGNVVFEPGCRTNWHKHPAGQILLITDGKGYYKERSKSVRLLSKGDVVVIPSNVEHWHGAAHDSSFTHIVVTNKTMQGAVEWLAPVTDEEYSSCQSGSSKTKKMNLTEAAMKLKKNTIKRFLNQWFPLLPFSNTLKKNMDNLGQMKSLLRWQFL